jgi:serine/threonine-protein kinase SRPK3
MNGAEIKKAAINKAKQVVNNANSNGGKKRRKGQDLKPIITTENRSSQDNSPTSSVNSFNYRYTALLFCDLNTPKT